MRIAFGLLALALLASTPAMAQDVGAAANNGTLNLSSGFAPDPQVVNAVSGGSIAADTVGGHCSGFISNAPDLRVNYTSGSLPLIISVASSDDTTLVINGPDGNWYCDDDGGVNGLNPAVRFGSPMSGRYEIWVGSYREGTNSRAQINVSEVRSQ